MKFGSGLLIGNTTHQERRIIANWIQDALSQGRGSNYQRYQVFLSNLQKAIAKKEKLND